MRKIAIFQEDMDIGGIQKSLLNLLNSIDYSEYCVDLYLFEDNGCWIDNVNNNVNIKILKPLKRIYKYLPFDVALSKCCFDFDDIEENYDLAIDYNSYQPWTAAAAILVPANKRVMWVHNDIEIKYSEEWKYRVLFNVMKGKYKYFEAFAFVSSAIIEPFLNMTNQKDKEFFTAPNIVNTDEIMMSKDAVADDIEFCSDCINVCAVGRLCHQKGYDIMIDEFSKAFKRNDKLRLYIIGGGPDYESIASDIKKRDLDEYIKLLGRKDNPYSYMNKCDALLSTSRYEGQGINIMEAKALGLQIIIPKHLEKYVEGISATDDLVSALVSLEKMDKIPDNLSEYNTKTLAMIEKMCYSTIA